MLTIGDFNSFWVFLGHPVHLKSECKLRFTTTSVQEILVVHKGKKLKKHEVRFSSLCFTFAFSNSNNAGRKRS